MTKKLVIIGGGIVVVAAGAFALIYFVLFPTSSPKRFALPTATTAATATSPTHLAGRWRIGTRSRAGYRVREKLAFLPAESDAVGRTSAITGGATFTAAGKVTAAAFRIDVSTLASDSGMRDQRIRGIGLESDTYPTATFTLTAPLTLTTNALAGHAVPVTGVFDIHGTAKTLTVPVELHASGSAIEAVGSITFPWTEFGMTAPNVGGFVSVTDKATLEFDLRLARA